MIVVFEQEVHKFPCTHLWRHFRFQDVSNKNHKSNENVFHKDEPNNHSFLLLDTTQLTLHRIYWNVLPSTDTKVVKNMNILY